MEKIANQIIKYLDDDRTSWDDLDRMRMNLGIQVLGYINMPVAMIAILVTFDKGKAWTLFMMGVAVILTGLTLIEALVKTSKIVKRL